MKRNDEPVNTEVFECECCWFEPFQRRHLVWQPKTGTFFLKMTYSLMSLLKGGKNLKDNIILVIRTRDCGKTCRTII